VHASNDNFSDGQVAVGTLDSPVGTLLGAVTSRGLAVLEFTEPGTLAQLRENLRQRFAAPLNPRHPVFEQVARQLAEYFAGERRSFELPLDYAYAGSEFQRSVWRLLLEIPYGQTWSYRDMADRLGNVKSLRAVGQANAANPIAIIIPCHRVINSGGALGGYGGGAWRKQLLLDLEAGQQRLGF
jgi:O-6-methylguanine DNA methyltransferase